LKALGVDLGARRIGLAVSAGTLALPHATIARSGDPTADRSAIVAVARDEGCDTIVVGLARSLDGGEGSAAVQGRKEIAAIRELVPEISVVEHDERFTTVIAERELRSAGVAPRRRRGVVDETAAAVMLQSFLDAAS